MLANRKDKSNRDVMAMWNELLVFGLIE